MKFFFSSPSGLRDTLFKNSVSNYLLSYAVDGSSYNNFCLNSNNIIIDSGAFSVWNKGGSIDIDKYINFINNIPYDNIICVSLDVIPKTNSTKKEKTLCEEQSIENYIYILSKSNKKIIPVHHYGDTDKTLFTYCDYTDYIGISPANDTHENVKREYLKTIFNKIGSSIKTHGLGYSSFDGLSLFPFYSCDSISYKRTIVDVEGTELNFMCNDAMQYLLSRQIKNYLQMEKDITELWEDRGVIWS